MSKKLDAALSRELLERQFSAAVITDCGRACTTKAPGQFLTVRQLSGALKRLYKLSFSAADLRLAVGNAHAGLGFGRVSRQDRRQAFHGITMKATPGYPSSLFAIWDKQLKSEKLTIGQVAQVVDLHKIARGEKVADTAREYLHANDWKKWPPNDREIWDRTYVGGESTRFVRNWLVRHLKF